MKDASLAKERKQVTAMDAENERLRGLFAQFAGTYIDVDAALQSGIAPSPRTIATTGRHVTIWGGAAGGSREVDDEEQDIRDHTNSPKSPPEGE